MSRRQQTLTNEGRARIARVVTALRKIDAATRTDAGLVARAGLGSRDTLYRVLDGEKVRTATLLGLDDGLLIPPGTLEAAGLGHQDVLDQLEIPADRRKIIDFEMRRVIQSADASNPEAI